MTDQKLQFIESMSAAYKTNAPSICLGTAMLNGEAMTNTPITLVLKSLSRHGLIAGATGTGKTKTIQLITELLSDAGIPSLVMDLKGDLSGLATSGEINEKIIARQEKIGVEYTPHSSPVEFLSLSEEPGVRLRATVEEYGAVLFSQMLELSDAQAGIISVIFKFSEDKGFKLIDLSDLKSLLNFAMEEGKLSFEKEYGKLSSSALGTLLRKIIELEQQGADRIFGEPSFEVQDLARVNQFGKGIISILRLTDIQDKPKLFSTCMLNLLTEVYRKFPEVGDAEQPKLVIFIDEAHLIFNTASKPLLEKIESMIKLIRSKAVGIFFCTQSPTDIPAEVLGQLGLKIQHALRAFTARDRKNIKLTAENYPDSPFYDTASVLTSMGIGEAAITALDSKGRPTPLAITLLQAPRSRMGALSDQEVRATVSQSSLVMKYAERKTREKSELKSKLEDTVILQQKASSHNEKSPVSIIDKLSKNVLLRQLITNLSREITRALMKVLGLGGRRR